MGVRKRKRLTWEDADHARWHAVQTHVGREGFADQQLRQRGYETLFLRYRDRASHARRVTEVVRPYMPGYLLLRIGPRQTFYEAHYAPGVAAVVCAGTMPLAIPLEVIAEWRDRVDGEGLVPLTPEEKEARCRYRAGIRVRINQGPFVGFFATVALDKGKQVRVWLALLSGRVPAEFRPEHLSPALRTH